jgi:hypothetical protein
LGQHTSAYVSIRQHTSAYVSIRQHPSVTSAYVSAYLLGRANRQHAQAGMRIRQHPSATSASVSIREHPSATSAYVSAYLLGRANCNVHEILCAELVHNWYAVDLGKRLQVLRRIHNLHTSAYVSIRQHTSAYVCGRSWKASLGAPQDT